MIRRRKPCGKFSYRTLTWMERFQFLGFGVSHVRARPTYGVALSLVGNAMSGYHLALAVIAMLFAMNASNPAGAVSPQLPSGGDSDSD